MYIFHNLSLEIKKTLIKSCIWSVALYGSETWTLGKNEERVINAFETWCWRRMLKIKWTDRITNEEVFRRVKDDRLLLKILNNRRHSWIGHIIRHKWVCSKHYGRSNIREKGHGKTSTTIPKASRQEHRSGQLYNNEKNSLQQIRMENRQPIKKLKKKLM